jgi:hypothetical protein
MAYAAGDCARLDDLERAETDAVLSALEKGEDPAKAPGPKSAHRRRVDLEARCRTYVEVVEAAETKLQESEKTFATAKVAVADVLDKVIAGHIGEILARAEKAPWAAPRPSSPPSQATEPCSLTSVRDP